MASSDTWHRLIGGENEAGLSGELHVLLRYAQGPLEMPQVGPTDHPSPGPTMSATFVSRQPRGAKFISDINERAAVFARVPIRVAQSVAGRPVCSISGAGYGDCARFMVYAYYGMFAFEVLRDALYCDIGV